MEGVWSGRMWLIITTHNVSSMNGRVQGTTEEPQTDSRCDAVLIRLKQHE